MGSLLETHSEHRRAQKMAKTLEGWAKRYVYLVILLFGETGRSLSSPLESTLLIVYSLSDDVLNSYP